MIDAQLAKTLRPGHPQYAVFDWLVGEVATADLDAASRRTVDDGWKRPASGKLPCASRSSASAQLLDASGRVSAWTRTHFRSAISCALTLVGTEGLAPAQGNGALSGPPRFAFPAVDQRHGAEPAWTTAHGHPARSPSARAASVGMASHLPIRPVVFEDPGTMDNEVVHLHLEQRVVQRLLGRFTAQGFVHHDLSRACLAQTSDAIPRVILLGRLCLYGPGAARLHEELIPVTARWTDPQTRRGPLTPYAREAEGRTLALLDQALVASQRRPITATVTERLQTCAPQDIQELLPHLQARGDAYARDAVQQLTARGDAEAKAMREILATQQKHIATTVAQHQRMDSPTTFPRLWRQ